MTDKIIQVGNWTQGAKRENPQRGRVYDPSGIAPSLTCMGGAVDLSYPNSKTRRGRVQEGGTICPTITAQNTGICLIEKADYSRKST